MGFTEKAQKEGKMKMIPAIVFVLSIISLGAFSTDAVYTSHASVRNNQFSTGEWENKIDLCHATGSETNPYEEISIALSALEAHLAHGDIYPVPAEGCPMPEPPESPTTARVVINEVYYDVSPPKGTETLNEWIELFNSGDAAANLKNWTLTDNTGNAKSLSLQDLLLNPQQFALIVKNIASFLTYWPETPASTLMIEIPSNNALSNDGDRLILKNENGEVMDQMNYGTDTTILDPAIPDVSEGQSIEREPDGTDTNTAADFVANPAPTPGS